MPEDKLKKIAYGQPFEHGTVEGSSRFYQSGSDWVFELGLPSEDAKPTNTEQ
jgi:hypothetical protein